MKIKELLQVFIETKKTNNTLLKAVSEELKDINASLNKTVDTVNYKISSISNMCSDLYTKKESMDVINKELDYREDLKKCKEENPDLLEFINKYCKPHDKYDAIEIYNVINKDYNIFKIKREEN